jgi:hypothetical protein
MGIGRKNCEIALVAVASLLANSSATEALRFGQWQALQRHEFYRN